MTALVGENRLVGHAASSHATAWHRHAFILGVLALVLLAIFNRDVATLVHLWWTSTTFGHCLFIGPVLVWLVWLRRRELVAVEPQGWLPGLLIVAMGGALWLVGDAASVALARQLGFVFMLQGAVVTTLGSRVMQALAFPLGYAFFLVPFGESLEAPMQAVTVAITMPLLHLAGVPASVDGVLITIPNGYFEVAEACSGAKFVLAMLAFGTLVANVCYLSWRRRAAFMAMALIVPVIANGIRAFATIYVAHLTSVARATGVDHIIYGWAFFALVMAAVLAIGWKWFDRDPDASWCDPGTIRPLVGWSVDVLPAAALALAVSAAFPVWAQAIADRADPLPAHIDLPAVPGWHRVYMSKRAPWSPNFPGSDHFLIGRYGDSRGAPVDLAIAVYGHQGEGREIVGFGIGPLREDDRWVRVAALPAIGGGAAIRIRAPGPVERVVATRYLIGDIVTSSEKRVKLETLKAKIFGGRQRAVALLVSAEILPGTNARRDIDRFVAAVGPAERLVDNMLGTAR